VDLGMAVSCLEKYKKSFKVKNASSNLVTTYIKKKVFVQDQSFVFWVADELLDIQANEMIKSYLYKKC
jgi:hypothetical protein